ncbi:trehalose-phosphatase [Dyella sp.]|jgi:trehalose 6-phosphate phosphatase|uniref:trehalose-phosphatase n=1 Tax=Dyella sp. TaxID=1869338 RepID=UPI002D7955F3|nr:trehalose-phosphatase [Dyella sp.]HET6433323.1 trehalose-phosphatase [Dyella sp.]
MNTPAPITAPDTLPAPPLPAPDAHWALFLDVDGTLLDFQDDPAAVQVSEPLLTLLQGLHRMLGGAMALVSGRALDDLDALFARPWAMAGLHGLQLRHADGRRHDHPVDATAREQLVQRAASLAQQLDVQLEDKGAAIALHCRRMPQRFDAMREAAELLAQGTPGYELQAGNLVMEIKPAGMDKGKALRELMRQPPFAGRRPVYVGDDLTDEHAFDAAAREGGDGVLVGARRPTAARFTLPSTAAVQHWLLRVHDALMQGASPHVPAPDTEPAPSS